MSRFRRGRNALFRCGQVIIGNRLYSRGEDNFFALLDQQSFFDCQPGQHGCPASRTEWHFNRNGCRAVWTFSALTFQCWFGFLRRLLGGGAAIWAELHALRYFGAALGAQGGWFLFGRRGDYGCPTGRAKLHLFRDFGAALGAQDGRLLFRKWSTYACPAGRAKLHAFRNFSATFGEHAGWLLLGWCNDGSSARGAKFHPIRNFIAAFYTPLILDWCSSDDFLMRRWI